MAISKSILANSKIKGEKYRTQPTRCKAVLGLPSSAWTPGLPQASTGGVDWHSWLGALAERPQGPAGWWAKPLRLEPASGGCPDPTASLRDEPARGWVGSPQHDLVSYAQLQAPPFCSSTMQRTAPTPTPFPTLRKEIMPALPAQPSLPED